MAKRKTKRTRKAATKRRGSTKARTREPVKRKPTPKTRSKSSTKKAARSDREPSGRKPSTQAQTSVAPPTVQGFPSAVKRRIGGIHARPPVAKPPKFSKHPDAIRARKYRREKKALAEALEAARLEKLERKRERDRERRRRKKGIIGGGGRLSERELAEGWLSDIRDVSASITPTSLEIVPPEHGSPTVWLVVGRFDLLEGVDYMTLGEIFQALADDLLLEAKIHPSRLSQIRVIYSDPDARKGEGDSIVSKIAGWQFALGDLIGEIVGGSPGDESALATRYDETVIHTFYVYFSATITSYETVGPWANSGPKKKRTQTVKLR